MKFLNINVTAPITDTAGVWLRYGILSECGAAPEACIMQL